MRVDGNEITHQNVLDALPSRKKHNRIRNQKHQQKRPTPCKLLSITVHENNALQIAIYKLFDLLLLIVEEQ